MERLPPAQPRLRSRQGLQHGQLRRRRHPPQPAPRRLPSPYPVQEDLPPGEVTSDQIVSGYEYAQDHYVVVDPDELDRLRTEADKAIKIDVFIASGAFDPLYGTGKR
ncbi:MAG TPA: Ku protein [Gemmataceae bacterium]|nr:Ku protein [Gemmataceae bacterium]